MRPPTLKPREPHGPGLHSCPPRSVLDPRPHPDADPAWRDRRGGDRIGARGGLGGRVIRMGSAAPGSTPRPVSPPTATSHSPRRASAPASTRGWRRRFPSRRPSSSRRPRQRPNQVTTSRCRRTSPRSSRTARTPERMGRMNHSQGLALRMIRSALQSGTVRADRVAWTCLRSPRRALTEGRWCRGGR